jgi:hypothetical protein
LVDAPACVTSSLVLALYDAQECGPSGGPPPLLCRRSYSPSPLWWLQLLCVACGGGCRHTLGARWAASKFELRLMAKSLLWYIRADHDGTHWCCSTSFGEWSWEIHILSVVSLLWFRAKALRCRCLLWAPNFLVEGCKGNLVLLILWQLLGLVGALIVLTLSPPASVVPSWCWSPCEHARLHFSCAPTTLAIPVLCVSVCVVFVLSSLSSSL